MKKRIVTIALVIALLATCFAGTYAYLQDDDAAKNTMTIGKVDIIQNEQQRADDGVTMVDFVDNKPALPVVGTIEWAAEALSMPGGTMKVFHAGLKNVVDKFVSVSNVGRTNAYVRTIIAIEDPDNAGNRIHVNVNDVVGVKQSAWQTIEMDGVTYSLTVFTYTDALAPGNTTPYSLAQVFLNSAATNEECEKYGETWDILCLSQAVQADGWEADGSKIASEVGLDTAFGEVDQTNFIKWWTEANP